MAGIQFLIDNIGWIKDLGTLIFTCLATVIAVLTYRRAYATILAPIRTEVVKKQTEILSKLLQILKDESSFNNNLDYNKLVEINVYQTLIEYGFIPKPTTKLISYLDEQTYGFKACSESFEKNEMLPIDTFPDTGSQKVNDYGMRKFEQLKNGISEIDKIYLTKKYHDFFESIQQFQIDPFMPTSIQKLLTELTTDINKNLVLVLKGELELFMANFAKRYFANNETFPGFNLDGVFNQFNSKKKNHNDHIENLRKGIRKHLRIDESW